MEQNNQQPSSALGLRRPWLSSAGLDLLSFINRVLAFLSLRETKEFWGIVYDSVNKQPLDPVIVKLLYADGREIDTCVTDLAGRYGFLARPGKFKIFARKTNYNFPSEYAAGTQDGVYENLYHGEFFTLYGDYEVVAPNIPMDPASFDWNQKAKQQIIKTHPYSELLLKRLVAVLFWFGFVLCGAYMWHAYPHVPFYLWVIAVVYLLLLCLASVVPEARRWGQLVFKDPAQDPGGWSLELNSQKLPGINFGRTVSRDDGKFLLRANKGIYILNVSKTHKDGTKTVLGALPVKIDAERVLNDRVVVG